MNRELEIKILNMWQFDKERYPIQSYKMEESFKKGCSKTMARLAYEEYTQQNGDGQSFERMAIRGGFGVHEMMTLLAQHIIRLKGDTS